MIDLETLYLREENRISPIKSDTNESRSESNGPRTKFDRIFQDHLQAEEVAKSGKKSPLILSGDSVSEHRSLAGGAQLILGGADPTDESIANYAAAQGIDPEILSLLMHGPLKNAETHSGQHLKVETGRYSGILSELTGEVTNIRKPMKAETGLYLSGLSELLGESEKTEKSFKEEAGVTANTVSELTQSKTGGTQLTLSGADPTHESIMSYAAAQGIDSEIVGVTMSDPLKITAVHSGKSPKLETGLYLSVLSELRGEPTNTNKSIKGETGATVSTLSVLAQNKIVRSPNEASLEKMQAFKQQFTMPSDSSKLKLDTIYLGRGAEDLILGIEPKTTAQQGAGHLGTPRTDSLLNTGQLHVAENRADVTTKSLVETMTDKDGSGVHRRQEQFLETSRRLTQAIGERLTTQITKGAWSVEMELHPKSLGRIEIQLEMRNGELAAHFNPSQNVTRDLLQESFDKLKATLAEHGIDSAYIGLGDGKKQNFDGKPTGDESAPEELNDDSIDEVQAPTIVVSDRIGSDGLDVQV